MDWTRTIFDLIDMRSFSNLWYWIALAVTWSRASHWIMGVPFDMVMRARRLGGQAEIDLEDMVRAATHRVLYITRVAGVWVISGVAFVLCVLLLLGFVYHVEFAQALVLIMAPLSVVGLLTVRLAHRIEADQPRDEALHRILWRHRVWVQVIGMVSIFVTAFWGMLQNYNVSILG